MRKIWDIHGGIHPPENKTQSLDHAIEFAGIPAQLILPVSQHIGAAASPVVQVGDTVLKGQCIAEAVGAVSVPIHAPSSGTVTAIEDRPIAHPSGLDDLCIVIDTDGKDIWHQPPSTRDFTQLDKATLVELIRNHGIAGMGGAGFPTSIKLNMREPSNIKTLILNGTECEPYITSDHVLMREHSRKLAQGIAILAKLVQPEEILLGVEDNKLDVVAGLQDALKQHDFSALTGKPTSAEVITFPTKYPSGGEKQLIEILTGKQVPTGSLPASLGIVCQNLGTAVAISDAVINDRPLISRITTVTGQAVAQPRNFEVLLGTPVEFLLARSGYNASTNNRLVMGGPMMGFTLLDITMPVVKTTNCILAPTEAELPSPPPAQACIRCGLCAEACPASLLPQQLFWFAQGKELEKLEQHNIADCIECGACSYVCPSNIPLVQYYRASKAEIRQRDADMQQAEHAKVRFDARQERLDRLEAEKIAARQARQAKAAANKAAQAGQDPKAAAVAAALARVGAKKSALEAAQNASAPEQIPAATLATDIDDPVQRALAKRANQEQADAANPAAVLQRAVESAEARLEKARLRLTNAESEQDNNVDAFKLAVDKCRSKLNQARAALDAHDATQNL